MNLRENIRKILTEGVKEKMIEFIGSHGLKSAVKFFGSWKIIEDNLGENEYTRKLKIDFIKELGKDFGGLSVFDLNEDPITFRQTDKEYLEITYFGSRKVGIQKWDASDWGDNGETEIHYENLSDHIIDEIFYMLMIHFEKGIEF